MRQLLLTTGLALVLAVPTAYADDAATKAGDETHPRETLHAPTNRVGKMVPTMKSDENASTQTRVEDNSAGRGQCADQRGHEPDGAQAGNDARADEPCRR